MVLVLFVALYWLEIFSLSFFFVGSFYFNCFSVVMNVFVVFLKYVFCMWMNFYKEYYRRLF